jgi:hypothetical protein
VTRAWIGIADGGLDLAHLEHILLELGARLELPLNQATTHIVDGGTRQVAGVLAVDSLTVDVPRRLAGWSRDRRAAAVIDDGVSVFGFGGPIGRAGSADAVARCKRRVEGRAIRFAGQDDIPEEIAVQRLVSETAIDRVDALGSTIGPADVIETGGFVRPRLVAGALVLHVVPLARGRFRPFEIANPHLCCEDPIAVGAAMARTASGPP